MLHCVRWLFSPITLCVSNSEILTLLVGWLTGYRFWDCSVDNNQGFECIRNSFDCYKWLIFLWTTVVSVKLLHCSILPLLLSILSLPKISSNNSFFLTFLWLLVQMVDWIQSTWTFFLILKALELWPAKLLQNSCEIVEFQAVGNFFTKRSCSWEEGGMTYL